MSIVYKLPSLWSSVRAAWSDEDRWVALTYLGEKMIRLWISIRQIVKLGWGTVTTPLSLEQNMYSGAQNRCVHYEGLLGSWMLGEKSEFILVASRALVKTFVLEWNLKENMEAYSSCSDRSLGKGGMKSEGSAFLLIPSLTHSYQN